MVRSGAVLVVVLFAGLAQCRAQDDYTVRKPAAVTIDSLRRNLASIALDKSFETFHWSGLARYSNSFGPLSLEFNEQYLSTVINAENILITDNQAADLHLTGRTSEYLDAALRVSSFTLSDNKNIGINNAFSHAVYGGVAIRPMEGIRIEPMIGRRIDQQLDHRDEGTSYLLTITGDTIRSSGYLTDIAGSFQIDKLSPRTLETYGASVEVGKAFDQDTRNDLRLVYNRNRRDFYLAADPDVQEQFNTSYNIETRADNSLGIIDSINYALNRRMLITAAGSVLTRQIDRSMRYQSLTDPLHTSQNTGISELRMEGLVRCDLRVTDRLHGIFTLGYNERNEQHQLQPAAGLRQFDIDSLERIEERKNNLSRRTIISAAAGAALSSSDSIEISGSGSILRYDTPSLDNHDDRDELLYVAGIATHHHLSPVCTIHCAVDLSMTHLVYLSSLMSANNTWNRIIRLSPKIEYTPMREVRTANTFEVLANYTVYDFEYGTSQTHSYVFRQFGFTDSTSVECTGRLSVEGYAYLRYYERGELRWDEFSERPVDYFEDKTFIGTLRYAMSRRLHFSVGIRYFSQMRYGFSGTDHVPVSSFRSIGPMMGIELGAGGRTDLSLKGWYEHQTQTAQPARGTTTLTMLLNVRI